MLELVDASSGTTIRDDVVIDVASSGSGKVAIVLHGVEGVQANREFIDALSSHYKVLAPSHPGFDRSPRPDWFETVEDLAYLYLSFLDQLEARDVVLIGLQFGGWVAAEMAVRSCERLGRLCLVDPVGIKIGGREERDIADVFALDPEEVESRIYFDASNAPGDLTELAEETVHTIARNEEALALYGWEPYLHNPRLRRWLRRITVPTLVLSGEHDGIVSPEYGRGFAESIPSAAFSRVERAGHRPQIERPDRVCELVTALDGGTG